MVEHPPLREHLLEWLFVAFFSFIGILLPFFWLVLMAPIRLWRAHRPARSVPRSEL